MKVSNLASALNNVFYPEAVGKLTDVNKDVNAPDGVSLAVDDLGYIKQGAYVSSGNSVILIEKTITENGTYNASDDSADGYSKVVVNVPSGGGETFEVKMTLNSSGTVFTTSKTLQETIDAIGAGKQIDFSLNLNGTEVNILCYSSTGIAIPMIATDGTYIFVINWVGNEDAALNVQIPMIIAGTSN